MFGLFSSDSIKKPGSQPALSLIFRRVEKWNAVLLLDEADVFVEQPSSHDVHRNVLVPVFLREFGELSPFATQ